MAKTTLIGLDEIGSLGFGPRLKFYRERAGLSMRKMAAILGVDESTIQRVEAGTRRPPRDVAFYERLRDVPGLTEAEIATLLKTDQAPRWLVPDREKAGASDQPPLRAATVSAPQVSMKLLVQADPNEFSNDDLDSVKAEFQLVLRDHLRRKKARLQRSD